MDDKLRALLSAPLEPVADDGFSDWLITKIVLRERSEIGLEAAVGVLVLCVVVTFVPLPALVALIGKLMVGMATSMPLAMACAALILSHYALRPASD